MERIIGTFFPIEEYKFGLVKGILNHSKDGKVMTNALGSILKKIKESNTISEPILTFLWNKVVS